MKKYILTTILSILCLATFAQERTVYLNNDKPFDLSERKWYAYNGNTADRLIPTTRDTIDYVIRVTNPEQGKPMHFYANFTFDTIAGADTTIAVTVMGKKFSSESYADIIASALTAEITGEVQVSKTTLGAVTEYTQTVAAHNLVFPSYEITTDTTGLMGYPADTMTVASVTAAEASYAITAVANSTLRYGYLKFRLILQGNDVTGTGIKMKRLEIQFF